VVLELSGLFSRSTTRPPHPSDRQPLLLRKPRYARGVNLSDRVLKRRTLDLLFEFAILDLSLQADKLPLLESLGEVGEIAPGGDAVPFGAGVVFALVVLPAFARGNAEDFLF